MAYSHLLTSTDRIYLINFSITISRRTPQSSASLTHSGTVFIVFLFTGIALPSLTSALYFGSFLCLVWCWILGFSIDLLHFSTLCIMISIFSGGHLLVLYLYQLPLFQHLIPPEDVYARYCGISRRSMTVNVATYK